MKRYIYLRALLFISYSALILTSCDDTTGSLGLSMSEESDQLNVTAQTFNLTSKSVITGAVVSTSTTAYVGKVRDPETGAYITASSMMQFAALESYVPFPEASKIANTENNLPVADSCEIRFYYNKFYGDGLAPMKFKVTELSKPMEETSKYYTDFDPEANGYLRTNGFAEERVFTLNNQNLTEEELEESGSEQFLRIRLNSPYTDKDGNTYNNFGTYLMRTYYAHPEYFKSNYKFLHNVMPGIYVKTSSGLGAMAYIELAQLRVYFTKTDSEVAQLASWGSTEEVLQTSTVENDENTLTTLAAATDCSYLKSPAGIFTEITLPVDEIMNGHSGETLNSAKIVLSRENNEVSSDYHLNIPGAVLLVPVDQYKEFFEQGKLPDSKQTFISQYSSQQGTYTFSNISTLITEMYKGDRTSANWNKVYIVPVTLNTVTQTVNNSTVEKVIGVNHNMTPSSAKLKGGANATSDLQISVIYSKF